MGSIDDGRMASLVAADPQLHQVGGWIVRGRVDRSRVVGAMSDQPVGGRTGRESAPTPTPSTTARASSSRSPASTRGPDGERAGADGVAQPGAGPPMHVHYLQEEAARVVSGRLGYQVLGRRAAVRRPRRAGGLAGRHAAQVVERRRRRAAHDRLVQPARQRRVLPRHAVRVDERERRPSGAVRCGLPHDALSHRVRDARDARRRPPRRHARSSTSSARLLGKYSEVQGCAAANSCQPRRDRG